MVRNDSNSRDTSCADTPEKRERSADQPIADLLRDLRDEASTWIRQETRLAKAEIGEKISHASRNIGLMVAGALTAYTGVIVLLFAASIGIALLLEMAGMDVRVSFLVSFGLVGFIASGVGIYLILKAKKSLSADELAPERTVKTLQDTKEWAGEKLK